MLEPRAYVHPTVDADDIPCETSERKPGKKGRRAKKNNEGHVTLALGGAAAYVKCTDSVETAVYFASELQSPTARDVHTAQFSQPNGAHHLCPQPDDGHQSLPQPMHAQCGLLALASGSGLTQEEQLEEWRARLRSELCPQDASAFVIELQTALQDVCLRGRNRECAKKLLRKAEKKSENMDGLTLPGGQTSNAEAVGQRNIEDSLLSDYFLELRDATVENASPPECDAAQNQFGDNPRREIFDLFRERKLPVEAAHKLTDPDGDYDYCDLESFVRVVTVEDLRAVGLKVAAARLLKDSLEPGGEVYNSLVVRGRLISLQLIDPFVWPPRRTQLDRHE